MSRRTLLSDEHEEAGDRKRPREQREIMVKERENSDVQDGGWDWPIKLRALRVIQLARRFCVYRTCCTAVQLSCYV